MVIFLVGFMGCGKSTIGKIVAKRLDYAFADTDRMVEQTAGKSVREIFEQDGEALFRRMETEALVHFNAEDNIIVATGGGTPCFAGNLEIMKRTGRIVYFDMKPDRLFGRLCRGRERRPKIAGMDDAALMDFIGKSLAEREKYYSQASMTIDCNGVSDEYIASHIRYYIENSADNSVDE